MGGRPQLQRIRAERGSPGSSKGEMMAPSLLDDGPKERRFSSESAVRKEIPENF